MTLLRLLELGCVPVVNENDAIASDEIRFGDNDRLAAFVSHLIGADLLLLLTDLAGLYNRDPRADPEAQLVAEVAATDPMLDVAAGGTGTSRGSGGMASKLTAAHRAMVRRARGDRLRPARERAVLRRARRARRHDVPRPRTAPAHASSGSRWGPAVEGRLVVDDGAARRPGR